MALDSRTSIPLGAYVVLPKVRANGLTRTTYHRLPAHEEEAMASAIEVAPERLETLRSGFSGTLLQPDDDAYDEARSVHNGLIDRRPALIARCQGVADVTDAIGFAQDSGLEICVRGGGHNVAGRAVIDGALMIDLSAMKGVRVDPVAARVHAQGGVLWGELNRETAVHGLAVTGGVISTTGIAGLTLGGGIGWLMPTLGIAIDNLISVDLVTAEGESIIASESSHPDLYWALRGGGGNFGVATSFEYRLHPLRQVVGGLVAHPLPAARDLLRFVREFSRDLPDELMIVAGLVHAPDGSGVKLAAVVVCHCGTGDQANTDLKPLLEFGEPAVVQVGPMPYPVMNTILDAGYPKGALNYWKSTFLTELSDDVIDIVVESFENVPSTMSSMIFEHFHGAVTRVAETATAWPHRQDGFDLVITAEWLDPAATDENIAWTKSLYAQLEPHASGRRYVNYLDDDDADAVAAAYGPNLARLADVKRRYDPGNVFHHNHNIPPVT
jgi:FAD/FMN-containing dehydrogenase